MRTIKSTKTWKLYGSGSYGSYYRLSRTKGIKVITCLREAKEEIEIQVKAYMKGLPVPKFYELVKVKKGYHITNGWGIIMQHITGKTLTQKIGDFDDASIFFRDFLDNIVDDFAVNGIVLSDLHPNNLVAKFDIYGNIKDFTVIDFSPEWSFIERGEEVA